MKAGEALKKIEEFKKMPCEELWPGFIAAAEVALREKAAREEKPSGRCSVSIAGGLVHGEWEQVQAVQALILENEKLRREAREREEPKK